MSPERKPGVSITEKDRGHAKPPQEITQDFIRRSRYCIYDSMANMAIEELRRNPIPLSPLTTEFWQFPQDVQNDNRRRVAKIVFKAINITIDTALTEGYFDPRGFYETCGLMFEDAGVQNPLPEPIESFGEIPHGDLDKMQKIHAKDPSNIRFLNKRLRNLPHTMRREFRRLGVTLLIIHDELIPQTAKEMEELGIPRTYAKRKEKKVVVISKQAA